MYIQLFLFLLAVCVYSANLTNKRLKCLSESPNPQPPNRINTTVRLANLRNQINIHNVDAFYIITSDEHQSEYISAYNKRLQYVSGFSGSSGHAIVTVNKAALWTDGRYHLQADEELDCNWELMKEGLPSVPKQSSWLGRHFPNGLKIMADPKLVSAEDWLHFELSLKSENKNFELVKSTKNLVDQIWFTHNSTLNKNKSKGYVLGDAFTGMNALTKVELVRKELRLLTDDAMIVTALDEVAWVLNIRGEDIPNSKLLYAILPYESIWDNFANISQNWKTVLVCSTLTYNKGASKAIYDLVPEEKRLFKQSPIIALKAQKNQIEILGMEAAHIRDSVALCQFLQYLEENYNSKRKSWNELRVAKVLEKFRSKQKYFVGVSFPTIAGFGPHGALPHYVANNFTSRFLYNNSTMVLDSGGQYYDGTTDVTRTVHLGTPTVEHKETYTRVLMGCIQLSSLNFPDDLSCDKMDVLARSALWKVGYDYGHGTGHGIGAFLNIHEAPIIVSYNNRANILLKPGYFLSIEPGIYLKNKFGVRLENIVKVVVRNDLKYNKPCNVYFGFEDITLVPYNAKLINFELLNKEHLDWLNKYNKRMKDLVGSEMLKQNLSKTYLWLLKNIEEINQKSPYKKSIGNKVFLRNYCEVLIVYVIYFYL